MEEGFLVLEGVPVVRGILLLLELRLRARVGVPHTAHKEGQAGGVLEDEEEERAVHAEGGEGHAGHGRAGGCSCLHANLAELQCGLMLHAGHHQPLVRDPTQVWGLEQLLQACSGQQTAGQDPPSLPQAAWACLAPWPGNPLNPQIAI